MNLSLADCYVSASISKKVPFFPQISPGHRFPPTQQITMADGADGSAATLLLQKSAQQRIRRQKNKDFLDYYYTDVSMTAEKERRGRRLHFSRLQKNEKEREHYSRDVNADSPRLINEPENNNSR